MADGVQYLALIRGINVGGKNLVKMAELREQFERLGFADAATYIQSGNVLFRAPRSKHSELSARIESELSRRFGMELKVVLLTRAQLEEVVADAPRGFGGDAYKCDVVFLRAPLTAKRAFGLFELRPEVDQVWAGKRVIYFSRLAARASASRLSRVVLLPEYQNMTIRSWSTTAKLAVLMAETPG